MFSGPRLLALPAVILALLACAPAYPQSAVRKTVLVIHSHHADFPWTAQQHAGIQRAMGETDVFIRIVRFHLDARRIPLAETEELILELLRRQIARRPVDGVLVTDQIAADFLLRHAAELAPGLPVVFSGLSALEGYRLRLPASWSGITENYDHLGTVRLIARIRPRTRHLLVFENALASQLNLGIRDSIGDAVRAWPVPCTLEWIEDASYAKLQERLRNIGPDTSVLLGGMVMDDDGMDLTVRQGRELEALAGGPVFPLNSAVLRYCGLAGRATDGERNGLLAGRRLLELMSLPPEHEKRVRGVLEDGGQVVMARYSEMRRWGVAKADLPPDAVILGEPPGLWESYGWQISAGLLLTAGLAVSVVMLFVAMRRQRSALRRVLEGENLYRSLLDQMPDAVFLIDLGPEKPGTILSVNPAGAELHGWTVEEMLRMNIRDVDAPEAAAQVPERLERLRAGEVLIFSLDHLHRDGTRIPLEVTARLITWRGRPCVLAMDRDLRPRRRQERRFRAIAEKISPESGDEFFRAVIEFAAEEFSMDMVVLGLISEDGKAVTAPHALLKGRFIGPFRYDLAGTPCSEVLRGESCVVHEDAAGRYPEDRFFLEQSLESYIGLPLVSPEGKSIGLIAVARRTRLGIEEAEETMSVLRVLAHSVTSQFLATESLRRVEASERMHRNLIEITPLGVVILQDRKVVYANDAARRIVGMPEALDIKGAGAMDFVAPGDRERAGLLLEALSAARPVPPAADMRLLRMDGTEFPAEARSAPTVFGGKPASLILVTDLSERFRAEERRRQLEAQLRQAQKMEAVGTLAGGVAHDFNNILTAILGNLELAESGLPRASEERRHLAEVRSAAERARNLVARLMAFGRRTDARRSVQDIARIARETLLLMRPLIPSSIELREDLGVGEAMAYVDATQIQQVVLNLCGNAVHAMQGRNGMLDVALCPVEIQEADAQTLGIAKGRYHRLTVRDDGIGMDEHTLERIFEPFFTTKPAGVGTGLGLAMVHGAIHDNGGAIRVTSRPGEGTTFDVFLPQCDRPSGDLPAEGVPRTVSGATLLVVDDEPGVLLVATRLLASLGYKAVSCSDPRLAAGMIAAADPPYSAVVCDLTMPHLNGIALLAEIRKTDARLPVLLSSGYTGSLNEQGARDAGFAGLLQKPYSGAEIAAAIGAVLAGSSSETATA